jgi:hypothetical protein
MSWRRDSSKLRQRSWRDIWLLGEAALWLWVMQAAVWMLPFRRVAGFIGLEVGEGHDLVDAASAVEAERIGWAVRAAGSRLPWASACLAQALAGSALLRRRGIAATLFLGAKRDGENVEALAAHAWLRCGEQLLTGGGVAQHFTVVSSFNTLPKKG